jgi:hypothetical protein
VALRSERSKIPPTDDGTPPRISIDTRTEEQLHHLAYITSLVREMRRCLGRAERARDQYFSIRLEYETRRQLSGYALDKAVEEDATARGAASQEQLYSRWAQMYAALITAERDAYALGLSPILHDTGVAP